MTQPVNQRQAPQQSRGISGNELYKRVVKATKFLVKTAGAAPEKYKKEIGQTMDLTNIAKLRNVSLKAPVDKAQKLVQAAKEKDLSKVAYATADLIQTVEGQTGNILSVVGGTDSLLQSLQEPAFLSKLKDTILSGTKKVGITVGTKVALPIQLLSNIAKVYKQTKDLQKTNEVLAKVDGNRKSWLKENEPLLENVLGKGEIEKIKNAIKEAKGDEELVAEQVVQKLHRVKTAQTAALISTLFTILSIIATIVVAKYPNLPKIWALIPTGVTVITMGITVGLWAKAYFETEIDYVPEDVYSLNLLFEVREKLKPGKGYETLDFVQIHKGFRPPQIKGNSTHLPA